MSNVILGEQRQDHYEKREKLENYASINEAKIVLQFQLIA